MGRLRLLVCPTHSTKVCLNRLQLIFMKHVKKKIKKDKQQYYNYLRSQQWMDKRKLALDFYGNNCGLCGSKFNLQVHHRNYKNIFKERMEDLMLLCESCHHRFHKKKSYQSKKVDTETITYYPKKNK